MQSHLPSCWVELYLTAWWPPPPWRLHLASFALFHLSLGLHGRGGTPKATAARARKVLERVPGPWFATHGGQ